MRRDRARTFDEVLVVASARTFERVAALAGACPVAPTLVHAELFDRALADLGARRFDALLLDLGLGVSGVLAFLRHVADSDPFVPAIVLHDAPDACGAAAQRLARAGAIATLDLATMSAASFERTLVFTAHVARRMSRLHELAHRDALTGLHNRRALERRIDRACRRGRGALLSLLFVDVDGFKKVNDELGHANGDLLLQTLAARLRGVVRGDVTIARLGGDEFAILLEGIESTEIAELVARRIVEAFERPISLGGRKVQLSASVGIAFGRSGDRSVRSLLREADSAMYEAKGLSGGCYVLGASLAASRH